MNPNQLPVEKVHFGMKNSSATNAPFAEDGAALDQERSAPNPNDAPGLTHRESASGGSRGKASLYFADSKWLQQLIF
jgi:hypothetical protein